MSAADRLNAALADRYRIERELGAGGMATVYLAEDLKHDRKVAVKVLKPELTAVLGADRFIQEIKTTASLQHPHILPLFDSGTADGFLFYVMPYIEGETLRDKLTRETQLGIDEAVRITREVADALDYAHRNGIIHRDIKPENVLLHDGRPMVADFGIALAVSAAAGGRMTETGTSVGTPHYMSPEQATADKEITGRADIYSLASVLYEMLTGSPPHVGSSAQQVIMRIIADAPRPVTEARKSVPPNVAAAVMKALEKLPADRFAGAKSFADALADPHFTTELAARVVQGSVPTARAWLRHPLSWAAAVVVLGLAVAHGMRSSDQPVSPIVFRAETELPRPLAGLDVSPDGRTIVYAVSEGRVGNGTPNLWVRRLAEAEARLVPGVTDAGSPVFSPDGRSIAYVFAGRSIRRVDPDGGSAETIATVPGDDALGLRWADDGYVYFDNGRGDGAGITRVPAGGGTPEILLTTGNPGDLDPLPGGRYLLYTEWAARRALEVRILDLSTGQSKSIGQDLGYARFIPSGHLLLRTGANGEFSAVVPFDLRRLEITGVPVPVLDTADIGGRIRDLAVSRSGTAAWVATSRVIGNREITLIDSTGSERRLPVAEARIYYDLRFSRDGRRLAMVMTRADGEDPLALRIYDLVLGTTTRFPGLPPVRHAIWTPSGDRIIARTLQGDSAFLLSIPADGSAPPDVILRASIGEAGGFYALIPSSISPDGRWLVLEHERMMVTAELTDLWRLGPRYLSTDAQESAGQISPDGSRIAYVSNQAGRSRVLVRTFPDPGPPTEVSDSLGGTSPRWSNDGRTIYYARPTAGAARMLVAAEVRTNPVFTVIRRTEVFPHSSSSSWDVRPDGRLLAAVVPSGGEEIVRLGDRLVITTHWLDELREKLEANR